MPLNIFLRPGDVLTIDEDIRIRWDPAPGRGRRVKLLVTGKGHEVRLEKRGPGGPDGNRRLPGAGDADGNR